MAKGTKRSSIRKKILYSILAVSISSLIIACMISLTNLNDIKNDSEKALIENMKENFNEILYDKIEIVNLELQRYMGYVDIFSAYLHDIYTDFHMVKVPDNSYEAVKPFSLGNNNRLSLYRVFRDESVKYENIQNELRILSNIANAWRPILRSNRAITSIYLGTKSGLLIIYDNLSYYKPVRENGESYYDFTKSAWYKISEKRNNKASITNIYNDHYTQELTISCSKPFYDDNDEFAGVVCIDIRLNDFYQYVMSSADSKQYKFMLIDSIGNQICPIRENFNESIIDINIGYNRALKYTIAREILSGRSGIDLSDGFYYIYAPIPEINWKYCLIVPESTLLASVKEANIKIVDSVVLYLIIMLCSILLIFLVSNHLSYIVTIPLNNLKLIADKIRNGDIGCIATIYNNDEIGDVARSFNDMITTMRVLLHIKQQ